MMIVEHLPSSIFRLTLFLVRLLCSVFRINLDHLLSFGSLAESSGFLVSGFSVQNQYFDNYARPCLCGSTLHQLSFFHGMVDNFCPISSELVSMCNPDVLPTLYLWVRGLSIHHLGYPNLGGILEQHVWCSIMFMCVVPEF